MLEKAVKATALGALILVAAPASAQYDFTASVIGVTVANMAAQAQEASCLSGTPLPEKEAREADGPAQELMTRYWTAASLGQPERMTAVYQGSRRATWVANGRTVRVETKTRLIDPLASVAGHGLVEQPLALVRGGAGDVARGIWQVKDADGQTGGYYLVDFVRRPDWRVKRIELLSGASLPPEVRPFCHKPGDVDEYKAAVAELEAKRAARQARRDARLASEQAKRASPARD